MRLIFGVLMGLLGVGFYYAFMTSNGLINSSANTSEAMQTLGQPPLFGPGGDSPTLAGEWGDVVVNQTQLSRFVQQYGAGQPAVGMGDIEMSYGGRQAIFTFQAVGECQRQMQFLSPRIPAMAFLQGDGSDFFSQAPACREEMPLRDLKIRFDALLGSRFMQAPIYITQLSFDHAIQPDDDVFDVVRKFGLPPRNFTTSEPIGMGNFREYQALGYPGVTVVYNGSYEYVTQWYRYSGAARTAQDFVAAINTPSDDPDANRGREELRQSIQHLTQDSGLEEGLNLLSDFEDQLAPQIMSIRLNPTPTKAMLDAMQQY